MSNDSMNASIPGTNIFVTGFMGTGKSSVGRCLAKNIGFAFLDTDTIIESEAGATISDIFRTRGERWFRQMEARVVRRAAKLNSTVISLGGGALIDRRNVDTAKRSGVVVWLRVSPEAVLARLSSDTVNGIDARPVLGGEADIERLRFLMRVREPGYRQAHVTVDTDGKSPGEVACEVAQAVSMHLSAPGAANPNAAFPHGRFAPRSSPGASIECGVEWTKKGSDLATEITAGTATYPYFVGQGTLTRLGTCLSGLEGWGLERSKNPRRVIAVTSSLLRCLFGTALERGLRDWSAGSVDIAWAVVPEGESAKTLSTLARLYGLACAAGAKRDCLVVALGGGTVGDVAGFFAATYMRGVRLVHVPTTLLAMVDSAIGGKTAINLKSGKNLAGTFWQPISVVSDVDTLKTLPPREFTNGLAEAVKAAVIGDPVLFNTLDGVAEAALHSLDSASNPATRKMTGGDRFAVARALQHDPGLLQAIICRAVAVKARIVSRDERDTGDRLLLNLGHTLGHAIEQAGDFRRWTHGEAVAIGLAAACRASTRLGRLPPESSERVINLLSRIGLPTSLSREQAARLGERIKAAMSLDKKAGEGGLRVILPTSIGQCSVANDVPAEILLREMTVPSSRVQGGKPEGEA
ncbi:MAG: 3-dehydroquinate synthase [Bacillota bacterium]